MKPPKCRLCEAEHWPRMAHVFKDLPAMTVATPGVDPAKLARVMAKPLTPAEERAQLQLAIDQLAEGIKKAKKPPKDWHRTMTGGPTGSVTKKAASVTESPSVTKKGRPVTGKAQTHAERQKAYRDRKDRAKTDESIERGAKKFAGALKRLADQ